MPRVLPSGLPRPGSAPDLLRGIPWRALALIALVAVAYHYTFESLISGLTLQTPLAYLGFVPILALVIAWARLARSPVPLPIHDRQLDYIVGLTLIGLAGSILWLMPSQSAEFWLSRLDLVSLPFFVAGTVALLFGTRRLWAVRIPIFFLFLAWPAPYIPVVGDAMRAFADLAAAAVGRITTILPFASVAPGDPTLFFVGSGPSAFAVSIGSACSGVNGLVGYLLLGGVLADLGQGSRRRRLTWLAVGLVLVWVLNVVRIMAILAAGAAWGQAAALDVLHPYAGLVLFDVVLFAMLAVAPRFGVHLALPVRRPDTALAIPSPVRKVRVALAVGVACAVAIGLSDGALARYSAVAGELGNARIAPLNALNSTLPGWQAQYVAAYPQAQQFFGTAATWNRVLYSADSTAPLRSSVPIYLDVINTTDPGTLAAYGLDACYQFHGYRIDGTYSVDVGSGVTGQVIDYHNTAQGTDWSALWWEWPYTDGTGTYFERVVIFVTGGPDATYSGAAPGPTVGAPRFQSTDDFLVSMGRAIVTDQLTKAVS